MFAKTNILLSTFRFIKGIFIGPQIPERCDYLRPYPVSRLASREILPAHKKNYVTRDESAILIRNKLDGSLQIKSAFTFSLKALANCVWEQLTLHL